MITPMNKNRTFLRGGRTSLVLLGFIGLLAMMIAALTFSMTSAFAEKEKEEKAATSSKTTAATAEKTSKNTSKNASQNTDQPKKKGSGLAKTAQTKTDNRITAEPREPVQDRPKVSPREPAKRP